MGCRTANFAICNNVTFFENFVLSSLSRSRLPLGFAGFRPDLGEILRRRRRNQVVKQQALADAVGITRESLSRIESGRSWPLPDTLDGLMRELDLDWHQLAIVGVTDRATRAFDGTWRGDLRLQLGRAVREARRLEKLKLRELALRCCVSVAQLSRIERGEAPRSRVYEDHPDDADQPKEYRRLGFRDPELRRLSMLID
jgi:transcriptional regulator with XRE-family HTH domain